MSSETADFLLFSKMKRIIFDKMLRQLRKEHDLTQAQLANKIGVGEPTIRGWESGSNQTSFEMLYTLAQLFNVTVGQLLGVEEY